MWPLNRSAVVSLRRVKPSKRMDRVEFDSTATCDHVAHIGHYTCSHCGGAVEFTASAFEKHAASKATNLDAETHARFLAFRPVGAWEFFLDFECPGCKSPVMLVFGPGRTVAMGCHTWLVKEIVEARRPPESDHHSTST